MTVGKDREGEEGWLEMGTEMTERGNRRVPRKRQDTHIRRRCRNREELNDARRRAQSEKSKIEMGERR